MGELIYLLNIRDDYDRFRVFEKVSSQKYRLIKPSELPLTWGLFLDEAEVEKDGKVLIEGWVVPLDDAGLRREFINQITEVRALAEHYSDKLEEARFDDAAAELNEAINHMLKAIRILTGDG